MAKGTSLHIGLNGVDPKHYGGWPGTLAACEADAEDMAAIATAKKFSAKILLTTKATRKAVLAELARAARTLKAGDTFFLTYSGHGGQLPDKNGDEIDDHQDETWCLYDGQVPDDELNDAYAKFAKGVRVLVLSDSCHSGTVTKMAFYRGTPKHLPGTTDEEARYRMMPDPVALKTYRQNKAFYDPILTSASRDAKAQVQASVLLISGCQDNQLSGDGAFNGVFTGNLLAVWQNGDFVGDYTRFHRAIVRRMPPDQTPNLFRVGAVDKKFEVGPPFSL
jgi:metacaspase-1